ncbi:MAG: hypothetical protein IT328_09395 [Caldilineaceae bacterium]|nr:hypothetical protein [Caldilineaceae bacterium]
MRDEQQERNEKELQPQFIPDGDNKYQLIPFEARVSKLSIQGFEYKRVAVKLGMLHKTLHERSHAPAKNVSITPTSDKKDDPQLAFDELAEELASINIFEMLLAGYLHTKEETPEAAEVAEMLDTEGQAYSATTGQELLVDHLMKGEVLPYPDLPQEEQVYSISQGHYLSTVEQEYLVEALRITRESRKLAELIREERELSRGQAYSVRILAAHVKQYAQQLQQQNQKNQRLSRRIWWLAIGLGVSLLLGSFVVMYAFYFN